MKKWLLLFVLFSVPALYSQDFVIEGFASTKLISDKIINRSIKRLKKDYPDITSVRVRKMLAKRGAYMDAARNTLEYKKGIKFQYISGIFNKAASLRARTRGRFFGGKASYRQLPSGIVVATIKLKLNKEIKQNRSKLKIYEVEGICKKKQVNILMELRQARMDAICKGIELAAKDNNMQIEGKILKGKVYVIKTITDSLDKPYKVKIKLQVQFYR